NYGVTVKKKQKGAILELKRRHLKKVSNCINTPYPTRKIRRICSSSSQERVLINSRSGGLLDVVGDWLPNAEHRKYTRHVHANFKKKYSGLQLQRLFWGTTSSTVEELFYAKMDDLKYINLKAYKYLVARNPNSWCRAFFILNVKCAAFENGISESYHMAILLERLKLIITMLEDIRIYIMQRLVAMNKFAVNLEDQITPTVRKRLEYLKQEQRTKASINFMVNTQESVTHGQPSSVEAASVQPAQFEPAFAEGPSVEPAPFVPASDNAAKKKGKE
ncbi:hypothetical protein Tco_1160765, partial [Tanacetum coccineum]